MPSAEGQGPNRSLPRPAPDPAHDHRGGPPSPSPSAIAAFYLQLTLPYEIRIPLAVLMDRLQQRLYETHEEIIVSRLPQSLVAVHDISGARTPSVSLRVEEGRKGAGAYDDDTIDRVFDVPHGHVEEKTCPCTACKLKPMDSPPRPRSSPAKRRAVPTIADIDVNAVGNDEIRSPTDYWAEAVGDGGRLHDSITSPPSTPRTPNASRSRRPSEKHDYGINWIEAFKMVPARSRKSSTLAEEVEGKLKEEEEEKRIEMRETLEKIDRQCKANGKDDDGVKSTSKSLFDSSITLKDIYGDQPGGDDVVFNTSISLEDVFAGMESPAKKPKKKDDFYYHHDEEEEEDHQSVLPPEVAALYASPPPSASLPLAPSSVAIDDVFAALEGGHFYPSTTDEEVFSDSARCASVATEQREGGRAPPSTSSSGCSTEEAKEGGDSWISSLVASPSTERRGGGTASDTDTPSSPSPVNSSMFSDSPPKTRKSSYLRIGDLFPPEERPHAHDLPRLNEDEDEGGEERGRLLEEVFAQDCHVEDGAKCTCSACDPSRTAYLEREIQAVEERKRSLHVVDPVNISLAEIFDGAKRAAASKARDDPSVEIDLDEIFTEASSSKSPSRVDIDKFQPRVIVKEIRKTEVVVRREERRPDLPLSPITLDDVFNAEDAHPNDPPLIVAPTEKSDKVYMDVSSSPIPQCPSPVPGNDPDFIVPSAPLLQTLKKHSVVVEELAEEEREEYRRRSRSSSATRTLDAVFAATPSTTSPSRVDIDKFQPRTLERESRRSVVVETRSEKRERTLPDSEISVDDIFTATKAGEDEDKRHSKASHSSSAFSQDLDLDNLPSPRVEVNLDEVFVASSSSQSRIDFDKYQKKTIEKEVRPVASSTTAEVRRERELPDSAIDVDEIFGGNKKSMDDEELGQRSERQPTNIDRDDVVEEIDYDPVTDRPSEAEQEKAMKRERFPTGIDNDNVVTEVDMGEIFTAPSTSISQSRVDVSKFEPRSIHKEIRPVASTTSTEERRTRELADSAISVDEIFRSQEEGNPFAHEQHAEYFEAAEEAAHDSTPDRPSCQRESEEITVPSQRLPSNIDKDVMVVDVDIEEIFNALSSSMSPSRVDISKFQPRTIHKEIRPVASTTTTEVRRTRELADSDISVEEIFSPQRPPRESSVEVIEEDRNDVPSAGHIIISKANGHRSLPDRPSYQRESEVSVQEPSQRNTSTIDKDDIVVDVDMEEIFNAPSSSFSPSRVDISKFKPRSIVKEIRPVASTTTAETRRERELADSDISVDDIFPSARIQRNESGRTTAESDVDYFIIVEEEIVDEPVHNDVPKEEEPGRKSERMPTNIDRDDVVVEIDYDPVTDRPSEVEREKAMKRERLPTGIDNDNVVTEVDMDEIFTAPSSSISQSRVDVSKFEPRTIHKEIRPVALTTTTEIRRTRELADSNISVEEIFEAPRERSEGPRERTERLPTGFDSDNVVVAIDYDPIPNRPSLSSPLIRSERAPSNMDDVVVEVDLDEVFSAASSATSPSRVNIEKFTPRTIEKEIRPVASTTSVETTRQRELPDSKIDVDDIFNPKEEETTPVAPPRSSRNEEAVKEFADIQAEIIIREVIEEERARSRTTSEAHTEEVKEVLVVPPVKPPRRNRSPLPSFLPPDEVNIDDVFASSSTPSTSQCRVDIDKFQPRTIQKEVRTVVVERVETRERTLPDSAITVDEIFAPPPIAPQRRRKSPSPTKNPFDEEDDDVEAETRVEMPSDDDVVLSISIPLPAGFRPPPTLSIPPPPPLGEDEATTTIDVVLTTNRSSATLLDAIDEVEEVKEARLVSGSPSSMAVETLSPAEISLEEVFNPPAPLLSPTRVDDIRWRPRVLQREVKSAAPVAVEKRAPSDLPESFIDVDEVFSGRLTTKHVEYNTTDRKRIGMVDLKVMEEPISSGDTWQDDLSREIDDFEARRARMGEDATSSAQSLNSSMDGSWRMGSQRSAQEPIIALLEREKTRQSVESLKKGGKKKRPDGRGTWKVEHSLEHNAGVVDEAKAAKKNGKMWRVDRVQMSPSERARKASIEDNEEEEEEGLGATKIQVHAIAPLDSLELIEREIDECFEEALSPRSRQISVQLPPKRPSSEKVEVEVHREDFDYEEEEVAVTEGNGKIVIPTVFRAEEEDNGVSTTVSIPSARHENMVNVETSRYLSSATIRLEKTLPTPESSLDRRELRERNGMKWEASPSASATLDKGRTSLNVHERKRSKSENLMAWEGASPRLRWEPTTSKGEPSFTSETTIYSKTTDREYYDEKATTEDRSDVLEDRGRAELRQAIRDRGELTTTVRVAGFAAPRVNRREARERRKKIIRHSRNSVSSSGSGSTESRPDEEELLEVEVTPSFIVLRGSYNLVISKNEPLGRLLLSLSDGQPIVPAALDFTILPRLKRLLRECMARRARSVCMSLSSRGSALLDVEDPANANLSEAVADLFHPINNPHGKINLCTAENRVCEGEVGRRLEQIRFDPESLVWLQRYVGLGGLVETKSALCAHFSRSLSSPISEHESVLLPSCTAAYDLLSHLSCDPHDIILTSTPYYARILNNCAERNQCRVESVPLDPHHPELIVSEYEREYSTWASKGERVRAVVVVNPHNPLGIVFPVDQIVALCDWAAANEVFVIVDEILSGTTHSGTFHSILRERKRMKKPENFAWMGSLSKDLGIPGVKTALVVLPSSALRQALTRLENLTPVPPPSQLMLKQILADQAWLSSTLALSRSRLSAHSSFLVDALLQMDVAIVKPAGGLCLMADFSKHMGTVTAESEDSLHRHLIANGVVLTKGESVRAPSPGWFRIAYGGPKEELELGVKRIATALGFRGPSEGIQYSSARISMGRVNGERPKSWLVADVRPTSKATTVDTTNGTTH